MTAGLIVLLVVAGLVLLTLARTIRIVPQARAGVVERLGRYSRTLSPGLSIVVPFVDRVRDMMDLREQVVSFDPQPVITEDNLVVSIDTVIYFQVTDAKAATYEIANYIQGIEQLTVTTLRNVIGGMALEKTLTSRDEINNQLRGVLDEATGKWGIRVNRVELKAIDPSASRSGSDSRRRHGKRADSLSRTAPAATLTYRSPMSTSTGCRPMRCGAKSRWSALLRPACSTCVRRPWARWYPGGGDSREHAFAGMMDGSIQQKPTYTVGAEVVILAVVGTPARRLMPLARPAVGDPHGGPRVGVRRRGERRVWSERHMLPLAGGGS